MRSRSLTMIVAVTAALVCSAAGVAYAVGGPAPVTVARYDFDGRTGAVLDKSGNGHTMTLVYSNGGHLSPVVHGAGLGLQFPAPCSGRTCPQAVLQTPSAPDLNPGVRPLSYGATIRLARGQTTDGQNVLQKGYSKTSSQYKLQVDGVAGRPSCALVGTRRPGIRLVRSSVSIADGAWHSVECRRAGRTFAILVDGVVRGTRAVGARLSISNSLPLSIGGKGAYLDNDQFQGALDDVWVRIG